MSGDRRTTDGERRGAEAGVQVHWNAVSLRRDPSPVREPRDPRLSGAGDR